MVNFRLIVLARRSYFNFLEVTLNFIQKRDHFLTVKHSSDDTRSNRIRRMRVPLMVPQAINFASLFFLEGTSCKHKYTFRFAPCQLLHLAPA